MPHSARPDAPEGVLEAAVYVEDLDAAEAFYGGVLGLDVMLRQAPRQIADELPADLALPVPFGVGDDDACALNLNYVTKARIDQDLCIKCGRCYAACEDTSHQAIVINPGRTFEVIDEECVACNLCVDVCPVENCITMEELAPGAVDARTGKTVSADYANWTTHPNNPMARAAE